MDDCPIGGAHVFHSDCLRCKFCILSNEEEGFLLCTGRSRISILRELVAAEQKRAINHNTLVEALKKVCLPSPFGGDCPQCGSGKLEIRESKHGEFVECSNNPQCSYQIVIDPQTGEARINTPRSIFNPPWRKRRF